MEPSNSNDATSHVLLTGASGYLGGHVLSELRRRSWDVSALLRTDSENREAKAQWIQDQGATVISGDLGSNKDLRRACKGITHLIHSAAVLGNWSRQNNKQFHINVDGTAALMRVALERKMKKVVYVSSIAAIGAARSPRPMDESEEWSWDDRPKMHYPKTKREGEERCLHAMRNGLPVVVVNPSAMLGRDAQGREIRGLCAHAKHGGTHRLMNGGTSFALVEDVAKSIVSALENGELGERYILGGANASWKEFYECAARVNGRKSQLSNWPNALGKALECGAMVLDGVGLSRPRWAPERFRVWGWYGYADSSKAQKRLGHVIRPLEEVLEAVYEIGEARAANPTAGPGT